MAFYRFMGFLTCTTAIWVLVGWRLSMQWMVAPIAGWPATVPTTALYLLLAGLALILYRKTRAVSFWRDLAVTYFMVALTLWGLAGYAFPTVPRLGQFFLNSWVAAMVPPFTPNSALPTLGAIGFGALTLIFLKVTHPRLRKLGLVTCLLGSTIPWVVVMAYSTHAESLVTHPGQDIGVAPFTTLGLLFFYAGLWSLSPSRWLSDLWTSESFTGKIMRWVLAINLLTPLVFSNLQYVLKENERFDSRLMVALTWCGLSLVFLIKSLFLIRAIADRENTIEANMREKEALIAELKLAHERVSSFNERLEEKVNQATENLTRSNLELQQFAYIASHDLQAPLRSISGYIQLVQRRLGKDADIQLQDLVVRTVSNVQQMRDMIQSILEFSRTDSKSVPFESLSLVNPLHTALDALQDSIEETQAKIEIGALPQVTGDSGQLAQLFLNLIGNAIKYHGGKPPIIKVSCQMNGPMIVVCVEDNGIGIEKNNLEKIFEVFKKIHPASQYPGHGIGLAICMRVVHRHGGRIWVESDLGRGSKFFFALPSLEMVPA